MVSHFTSPGKDALDHSFPSYTLPFFVSYFQVGQINTGMEMKCSSRHTFATIASIFRGPTPSNLYPRGVRLVEDHSLQSERRPNSPLSTQECSQWPKRRPNPFSSSIVRMTLGCRFCFLGTPGVHGLKY